MNLQMVTASNTISQLQKKVDTIANNIANLNTTGYKRREASFQDLLTQNIKQQPHAQKEIGRETPHGLRVGHGARIGQTSLRYEQGAVQTTERTLDVMIEGENLFFRTAKLDAAGNPTTGLENEAYTRFGSFQLQVLDSGEVRLVTSNGYAVLAEDGNPIQFGSEYTEFSFDPSGNLVVRNPATGESETFQLGMIRANRPDLLQAIGDTHFKLPDNLDPESRVNALQYNPTGFSIRQGALEASNVDLSHEMTELMKTQRLLQLQARAISMADDMYGLANSIRG